MKVLSIRGHDILLDDEDYTRFATWRWHVIPQSVHKTKWRVRGHPAEQRHLQRQLQYLHRAILNTNEEVDHIDGNPLNNQKSNLRIISRHCNQANRGKNRNNTSGYKGVSLDRRTGKYVAQISINHTGYYLGRYDTAVEAFEVYKLNAKEWWGIYAGV